MRHADSLNWQAVSLNFADLGELLVKHLNRTRFVVLGYTSEHSSATVEELNLRDVDSSLVGQSKLSSIDGLDRLINTSCVDNRL